MSKRKPCRRIPKLTAADLERFWSKVDKSGDCWEWTAGVDQDRYGLFSLYGFQYRTHRISYFITYGEDPGDRCVCHKCDNSSCVNPGHLWLGTVMDNNQDRAEKGRNRDQRGSKHNMARLSEKQAGEILASREPGVVLATKYGVPGSLISNIRLGKRWKHLEGGRQEKEMYANNTTGIRCISEDHCRGTYVVQFSYNKKRYRFSGFDTIAEAEQALIAKRIKLGCPN